MTKSIAIIGGGIAGLSAGCYGRMNGYTTTLFEMHDLPGGQCTAWKRNGYTVDGCIHWLVGSGPASSFHKIWRELGALQGRKIVDHEEYMRIAGGGKTFILYTDAEKLRRHMKELAPGDAKIIDGFIDAIRKLGQLDIAMDKPPELWTFKDSFDSFMKTLPYFGVFFKYGKHTINEFAAQIKDPFLREAFKSVFDLKDFPLIGMLMTLAWMDRKTAGVPVGGSRDFAQAIENRYKALGGEIRYKAKVVEILVENNRAVGVKLEDGTEHKADVVISAADGHATIFDMLKSKFIDDKIRDYYKSLLTFPPMILVSLGVGRDLSGQPHSQVWLLDKPVKIGDSARRRLFVKHYAYDSTLAPQGKTVVQVMLDTSYEYWKKLSADREKYEAEKTKIAESVIRQLAKQFPGLETQVEMTDVATPMTYQRYTGVWKGAWEGWLLTTKSMSIRMKKTLPGLENFYMAGQWVEPGGGLPPAAASGRQVIQLLCARDMKSFATSEL
jgi:phytoene dehydrogenase-like protein